MKPRSEHEREKLSLRWLGQAGFLLESNGRGLLVDPYLSDFLARKYGGGEFPHIRMMPPPVEPVELLNVDVVLSSHRHTDHMDPGTLPILAQNNPGCVFIVPRAEFDYAVGIGLPEDRTVGINAGDTLSPIDCVIVKAIPSAHEQIETDANGDHRYLGFIIKINGIALYHSGDCVPYDGLADMLSQENVDIALLPVNGRDDYLSSRGILGNFNIDEAIDLCRDAGIPALVPHHFGMFDFNTVGIGELTERLERNAVDLEWIVPDSAVALTLCNPRRAN